MIKNIICRLRELLIYVFKKVPILLLLEIWTIVRVLSTLLIVVYIIVDRFWDTNIDAFILNFTK
jgi:hypothetical protein